MHFGHAEGKDASKNQLITRDRNHLTLGSGVRIVRRAGFGLSVFPRMTFRSVLSAPHLVVLIHGAGASPDTATIKFAFF